MIVRPLTTNERAETPGFTHVAQITADDLTQATAAAAQTFNLCGLKKWDIIERVAGVPVVPFQNTADPAFNSTTVSVGDPGGVAKFLAATEANENGAEIAGLGNTPAIYGGANTLTATVNSMAGKSLLNINRGEYHIFFQLTRLSYVSDAIGRARISKA
jgi:hypothetical protein